jgi:branched-chain amino acid transport system substrate-binding protein
MELLKKWKSTTSPRGNVSIDPETRDVINPEYLREVRKVGGKLANIEIETISAGIKDPMKESDKKK